MKKHDLSWSDTQKMNRIHPEDHNPPGFLVQIGMGIVTFVGFILLLWLGHYFWPTM